MNRSRFNGMALLCVFAIAPAIVPAYAETAPSVSDAVSTSWDKEQLKRELQELEARVEHVRRTQGEGGVRRKGLTQKLAREKAMTEFHLQLIERLENFEQRLSEMEARSAAR